MFGVDHFYHERVRKSVAIFGSIFNDAYIVRRAGNKVVGQIRVPIAYAPKRKFLERIEEMYQSGNRDIENQTASQTASHVFRDRQYAVRCSETTYPRQTM